RFARFLARIWFLLLAAFTGFSILGPSSLAIQPPHSFAARKLLFRFHEHIGEAFQTEMRFGWLRLRIGLGPGHAKKIFHLDDVFIFWAIPVQYEGQGGISLNAFVTLESSQRLELQGPVKNLVARMQTGHHPVEEGGYPRVFKHR